MREAITVKGNGYNATGTWTIGGSISRQNSIIGYETEKCIKLQKSFPRRPLYGKLQRFFMKFPFIDIRARKNILPLLEL